MWCLLLVCCLLASCFAPVYPTPSYAAPEVSDDTAVKAPQKTTNGGASGAPPQRTYLATPMPEEPAEPVREEPRPASLGSAKTSAAARPEWVDSKAYAPQYKGQSPPMTLIEEERLQGVLLLCKIDASRVGSQDFFGGKNELGVDLVVGKRSVYGGFKSTLVSAPLVSLKKGDKLSLLVYDIDYISDNDLIESFSITYKGKLPIEVEGKRVSFVCGALTRDTLEAMLLERLPSLDEELGGLAEKLTPELYEAQLTPSQQLFTATEAHLIYLASLVGWDDPSVVSRVTQLEEARRVRLENLKQSLAEAHREAPPLGEEVELGALRVKATLSCDKKNYAKYRKFAEAEYATEYLRKTYCIIEMHIENQGVEEVSCCFDYGSARLAAESVNLLGESKPLVVIAERTEAGVSAVTKKSLQVGESRDLILLVQSSLLNAKKASDSAPVLLRFAARDDDPPQVHYLQLAPIKEPNKPQR